MFVKRLKNNHKFFVLLPRKVRPNCVRAKIFLREIKYSQMSRAYNFETVVEKSCSTVIMMILVGCPDPGVLVIMCSFLVIPCTTLKADSHYVRNAT